MANELFEKINLNKSLLLKLVLVFIAMTIIGTLSHECGHYAAAKYYARKAKISYASTGHSAYKKYQLFDQIYSRNRDSILSNLNFHEKPLYTQLLQEIQKESRVIIFAGPFQTMLFGSIGLVFLFLYRRSFNQLDALKKSQWVLVFCSLLWLREVYILASHSIGFVFDNWVVKGRSDELRLAKMFHVPDFTFILIFGVSGILVCAIVFFKFIPNKIKWTFLVAAALGSALGALLWFKLLGPFLLP